MIAMFPAIAKSLITAGAFAMLLIALVRLVVFRHQHWTIYCLNVLTVFSFIYLAASQFIRHPPIWMLAIALCEITLDMIVFWRLARPSVQRLRDNRRAMSSSHFAAEKIGIGLGALFAVGFIAIVTVVLKNSVR